MTNSQTVTKVMPDFAALAEVLTNIHNGKKIVHCHGVFDLLHIGHIKHFSAAKKLGDVLVVTVTPDRFVFKGPGRPYFTEKLRADAIAALETVDYVIINNWPTAIEAIHYIKPYYYVKGGEYKDSTQDVTGKILDEQHAVETLGGQIHFTDEITFSSSTLLNQFYSNRSMEVSNYLESFKRKFSIFDVLGAISALQNLKILVIGETIIDVYDKCSAIGKSGKEPILVAKHNEQETYVGGVLAIANHVSDFCANVTCLTYFGENKEYEQFIREKVNQNVKLDPIYKLKSPTIVKKRFLDGYLNQKLFEVYDINDEYLPTEQKNEFIARIDSHARDHDLIIIADYGHGLIDEEVAEYISSKPVFVCVNTQSNAGNHGFNCISKYPSADFVCIANRELQLAFRKRDVDAVEGMNLLINQFDYKNVLITCGSNGSYIRTKETVSNWIPAFNSNVKDRVGAGDAVLAITSPLIASGVNPEIVAFIGNIVGAQAVSILGNESFIKKTALCKHILHFLK